MKTAFASQAKTETGCGCFKYALSQLRATAASCIGNCVRVDKCVLGIPRGLKELTVKTSFASQAQAGTVGLGSFKFVRHSCQVTAVKSQLLHMSHCQMLGKVEYGLTAKI